MQNHLCRKCTCILDVDTTELTKSFKENDVKVYEAYNPNDEHFATIQLVVNVVSRVVCSYYCMNSEGVDSWTYDSKEKVCTCQRFDFCYKEQDMTLVPANYFKLPMNSLLQSLPFIILTKVLACGKLTILCC